MLEKQAQKGYNRPMWQRSKNLYHLFVAFCATIINRFPAKKLTVIGVTGTDGKTTTTNIIYHLLKESGKQVSMISTIGAVINGTEYDTGFHVTTPSPFAVQKFLRRAVEKIGHSQERQYMVLEVTSHAIDQNRIFGIHFDIVVLTNITHEHLDYHKTYENYVQTKAKLLHKAKIAIVNKDDGSFQLISNIPASAGSSVSRDKFPISNFKLVTYGMGKDSEVNLQNFPFKTKLFGEFNKYNCLAAIAVCRQLGISDEQIRKALLSFRLPIGRAEIIHEDDFIVMVDFAHTPNAIVQLLSSVKPAVKGKLIHVFGSAGERDHKKRPEMGRVSAEYADIIILTAEDPRSESVQQITQEIESGIKNKELRTKEKTLLEIPDRREAIKTALKMASKGDFIAVTGKGHERSLNLGKGEIPWSDQEVIREILGKNHNE